MRKHPDMSFLAAAKKIRMSPLEHRGMLDGILAHCVVANLSPILRLEEKNALRAQLKHMSASCLRIEHLQSERDIPLSVWLGSNLFSHLKSFVV